MSTPLLRALWSLVPALVGTLLVLAVVAVNGRPSVFTDTDNYFGQGRNLVRGIEQAVLPASMIVNDGPLDPKAVAHERLRLKYKHTSMAARSPFYGAFLFSLQQAGTLWLVAAVQAFAVAWLLWLLFGRMAPGAPAWTYYAMMAALAALTPLPLVAAFAVPDIFAAAAILGVVLLVVYGEQLARWERGLVWIILFASLIFHTSHLLTSACLLVLAVGWAWKLGADRRSMAGASALIAAALIAANLGMAIYGMGVKMKTGDEYRRPPFLAARVLADGPGRAYLRHACPDMAYADPLAKQTPDADATVQPVQPARPTLVSGPGKPWALCRFRNRPLDDSDEILWSNKPALGVFNRSTPEERLLIEKQEPSFVLHAIAYDPVGQFAASMKNWGLQTVTAYVDEALKDPKIYLRHNYWGSSNLAPMIRELGPCTEAGGCTPRFDWQVMRAVHNGITLLALAALVFRLTRTDALRRFKALAWADHESRALVAIGLVIAAVIINAAVCGMLSGVFARYQTRVIWLVPAMAALSILALAPQGVFARSRQGVLSRARALSLPSWLEPAFLRFGLVGACGFTVDAAILHLLVDGFGLNAYGARLVSFTVAVGATWLLNRVFTFRTHGTGGKAREALLYFGVQGAGGVANLAVYSLAIMLVPALKHWLLVPLALGSAAGLCLTYAGAKHLAFRKSPALAAE